LSMFANISNLLKPSTGIRVVDNDITSPAYPESNGHANGNGKKPIIHVNKLVKTFMTANGEFVVLKGIDLTFNEGEFVGVIGKSGSGKTTLINMLTGIDRPTSGEIYIAGTPVHELDENQLAIWRGRTMGIVFQFFQLLPTLTLLENIMLPMDFCHMYTPAQRKERAMFLLDMVELKDHAKKVPAAISGGQQQRAAIARALANDPPIIVADEPTGNLDSKTADVVFDMFANLITQGKTIVMVTHDASLAKRVSRTVLVADGEIVNEWVAQTFPTLTHQQLLEASHKVQTLNFAPGEAIIRENQYNDRFNIITSGEVEIALKRPDALDDEVVVRRLGTGEYFGEVELFSGDKAIATVQASYMPVEVLSLDRQDFLALLQESEPTRDAIKHIVKERRAENRAARGGNK
jgi:ABC-type lipoprotein export system ATPase subunit